MAIEKNKLPDPLELAELCEKIIDDGKGENIVRIPLEGISVMADFFILCTANSVPHIRALGERLKREVSRKYGFKPRMDGDAASQWIVLDFPLVVVHVLSAEKRDFYRLETLWGDSPAAEDIQKLAKLAD
ncbi:MAG: ribosome silencing factor, partial [Victivallales bacterium]|nr:ribosome silencing factor [Victivallales bacterium]